MTDTEESATTTHKADSQGGPGPASSGAPPRSLVEIPYRQKILLVSGLSAALIVTSSSQTVVATAAQNIVADIGGFELFTWMFAGFSLASAVAVPVIGKLADIHGTRPIISLSLVLFIVSSTAAGFVTSMEQMVVLRTVQGLSFAGVLGSVWITTASMWRPEQRAKWLGAISGAFTLAGVTGPILGGVVSDEIGWRWLFWFNLPAGLAALWFLRRLYPRLDRKRRITHFDVAGSLAFTVFATCALLGVSLGGDTYDWDSPAILGLFGFAALSLVLFIRAEFRAEDPVTPPDLFRHRVFAGAMAGSLTVTISFVVTTVFLPLLVIGAKGESATVAAYPLMSQAIGVAVGVNLSGQVLSRWGYGREIAAVGAAMSAILLWVMADAGSDISLPTLSTLTFLLGLGITFPFTAFTVPVQNAMPENVLGVVTTSLQFARVFGMAAGSAILGAVMLASIGIADVDDPGPQDRIRDPEVVVAEDRLSDVRDDYLADPELGEPAFETALTESRQNISDALSLVFRVAALGSAAGIVLAVYALSGLQRKEDEETAEEPAG